MKLSCVKQQKCVLKTFCGATRRTEQNGTINILRWRREKWAAATCILNEVQLCLDHRYQIHIQITFIPTYEGDPILIQHQQDSCVFFSGLHIHDADPILRGKKPGHLNHVVGIQPKTWRSFMLILNLSDFREIKCCSALLINDNSGQQTPLDANDSLAC